jgi:hypothetical protein
MPSNLKRRHALHGLPSEDPPWRFQNKTGKGVAWWLEVAQGASLPTIAILGNRKTFPSRVGPSTQVWISPLTSRLLDIRCY